MLRPDTPKLRGARRRMVEEVRKMLDEDGLVDERVLEAMMKVQRHQFFDSAFDVNFTYENKAFSIGLGQTISQPYIVALQTVLLEIKKRDKVLEVGTGSGYQAAILAELGAKVFTIERHKPLYEKATKLLREMGYTTIRTFYGDGYLGRPAFAPFDKIIITAAPPEIPKELLKQLKNGGYMVVPVGNVNSVQQMLRITKVSDEEFKEEHFGYCSFVPMLPKKA